jgi:hypothetical protein
MGIVKGAGIEKLGVVADRMEEQPAPAAKKKK